MNRRFRANLPAVASEVIDGEAVIMNLRTGAYFSTRQVGSLLWGWLEQGVPRATILQALEARFHAPSQTLAEALDRFIADLQEHDLIREIPLVGPMPAPEVPAPQTTGAAFVAPVLEVYTDMQDLLLLDPIHEVDEEEGWPTPRPPEELAS